MKELAACLRTSHLSLRSMTLASSLPFVWVLSPSGLGTTAGCSWYPPAPTTLALIPTPLQQADPEGHSISLAAYWCG